MTTKVNDTTFPPGKCHFLESPALLLKGIEALDQGDRDSVGFTPRSLE